ncbi:MAG TPA: FKBP-type peptidyl-prolyl cis-trans isomerase [Eudoraea sp.]|nr:FKBP-type peptidyl-prolyl cis-trans isomerase [Eudoraea sp.]
MTVFSLCAFWLGCGNAHTKEITLASGLRYEILTPGSGPSAMTGDEVIIHETMGYTDGTELFTTEGMGVNLPKFVLGRHQVIQGVEDGVKGMQIGEVRKLIIPPGLSKREVYPKFLSPDSTLVYRVQLVTINKPQ